MEALIEPLAHVLVNERVVRDVSSVIALSAEAVTL